MHYEQFADGTVKCIEDEIPFDIPKGWAWCRLEACCTKEIKRGKTPKYVEKSNHLVFAQKCNTKAGYINLSLAQHLDETTLKKYSDADFMQFGDIVINSTGTGTLGRVGIYEQKDNTTLMKVVPDSHITTVRVFDFLNAKYIYMFLKNFQGYLENSGEGSTNQKELRTAIISNIIVPLPPLREQIKISELYFSSLNLISEIDIYSRSVENLIEIAKSKILDLAIRGKLVPQDENDEPASVLLERIKAEKEEQIKSGKIKRDKKESVIFKGEDNSYYQDLPQNWRVTTLRGLTTPLTLNDGDWILSENMSINGEVKLLQLGSIGNMVYVDKDFKYITKNTFDELSCTEILSGYLLINRIISDKMCCCIVPDIVGTIITTVDTCWIAPSTSYDIKFLMYQLASPTFQSQVLMSATGTTRKRISKNNLIDLPLLFPPLAEQHRIVEAIETAFAQLDSIANSIS